MNERRMLCFLVLVAAGCTSRDPGGSSSATNFLTCKIDRDCLSHAGAVRCDEHGYCRDADGERIAANAPATPRHTMTGAQDAAQSQSRADTSASDAAPPHPGAGAIDAAIDSGSDAGPAVADAAVDAGLQPIAQCACNTSTDVKMPFTEFDPGPGREANILIVKFEDGARVRMIEGKLGTDPAGRDAQDLAELDCAGLDFASADAALAEVNALLAANPSVAVESEFRRHRPRRHR